MTNFSDSYWQWAARSQSADRAERKEAERDASPHLTMVERLSDGADSAAELIADLLNGPEDLEDWQIAHLCYGPLFDAVAEYGTGFLTAARFFEDSRGQRLAEEWFHRNNQ